MCKEVDEILEEVIKERRNSGQRIVWEEGFREGFKIGYEISTCKIEGKSLGATIMRTKRNFRYPWRKRKSM